MYDIGPFVSELSIQVKGQLRERSIEIPTYVYKIYYKKRPFFNNIEPLFQK